MQVDPSKVEVILDRVQRSEFVVFDPLEVYNVARATRRKMELNSQDESYLYLLFENELRDHVTRKRINAEWR